MDTNGIDLLLVEDNPNDVELTLDALKNTEVSKHIHIVRDGAEALDFIFAKGEYASRQIENPPKVVFLDLKLPKIDGIEVLKRMKSDPRTRRIPVVMLTSSREQRDMIESYDLGVNSYIVKPVDYEQFYESVRTMGLYWLLVNEPHTT